MPIVGLLICFQMTFAGQSEPLVIVTGAVLLALLATFVTELWSLFISRALSSSSVLLGWIQSFPFFFSPLAVFLPFSKRRGVVALNVKSTSFVHPCD